MVMRLVRNRRTSGGGDPPPVTGLRAIAGQPWGGREPASILDAPDDFIVRRYMRWRLGSRASEPGQHELAALQANAEFVAILAKSAATTVCLVLAFLLADWLAKSERVRGGPSLAITFVGVVLAIGVPAACLLARHVRRASGIGGQPAARGRWPGWLLAVDGLATVAGGIAFGYAALSEAGQAGLPPVHMVWLGPLAYTTTGVAALGVWLLPVPAVPVLARVLRRMASRIRRHVVGPGVTGTWPVRLREVGSGQRDTWRSGVLALRSGTLTWLGGDGTEFDLTDASVVTVGNSRLARAWTGAVSRVQMVRAAGSAGEFDLEIKPRLFKSYLAAASDGQGGALMPG